MLHSGNIVDDRPAQYVPQQACGKASQADLSHRTSIPEPEGYETAKEVDNRQYLQTGYGER